jgi:Tol biopolymer transport system component
LKTGYATRLTFHKRTAWHPLWSGDGRSIAYGLAAGIGKTDVMVRNLVDGSERRLWEGDRANWLQDWSRDSRLLLFAAPAPNRVRGAHLYALPIDEAGKAGAPYLVVQTEGGVWGRISPDGKWLVYCTDESGQFEIFVKKMPRAGEEPGAKWPIGSGGVDPKWSGDGSKIYYVALDRRRLMEVDVERGEGFEAQPPRVLFEATFLFDRTDRNAYDVTRDERFVVSTLAGSNVAPVHVMLNWHRMLERS